MFVQLIPGIGFFDLCLIEMGAGVSGTHPIVNLPPSCFFNRSVPGGIVE